MLNFLRKIQKLLKICKHVYKVFGFPDIQPPAGENTSKCQKIGERSVNGLTITVNSQKCQKISSFFISKLIDEASIFGIKWRAIYLKKIVKSELMVYPLITFANFVMFLSLKYYFCWFSLRYYSFYVLSPPINFLHLRHFLVVFRGCQAVY